MVSPSICGSVGWDDPAIWLQVLQKYPYGLRFNEETLQNVTDEINTRLGGGNRLRNLIPYVRADWFVATASRPPLYDVLLKVSGHRSGPGEGAGRAVPAAISTATSCCGPPSRKAACRAAIV